MKIYIVLLKYTDGWKADSVYDSMAEAQGVVDAYTVHNMTAVVRLSFVSLPVE